MSVLILPCLPIVPGSCVPSPAITVLLSCVFLYPVDVSCACSPPLSSAPSLFEQRLNRRPNQRSAHLVCLCCPCCLCCCLCCLCCLCCCLCCLGCCLCCCLCCLGCCLCCCLCCLCCLCCCLCCCPCARFHSPLNSTLLCLKLPLLPILCCRAV
jgi:hypothetical protein